MPNIVDSPRDSLALRSHLGRFLELRGGLNRRGWLGMNDTLNDAVCSNTTGQQPPGGVSACARLND